MFDVFNTAFLPDERENKVQVMPSMALYADGQLRELLTSHGGNSFNQGLYRIISFGDVAYWSNLVLSAFPSFSGRVTCFGVDWLGRVFGTDSARLEDMRPGVVMLEPGTGEALEIPCNIESFHENELIQYQEAALAVGFYRQWRARGGALPDNTQCIGYKKPLFLGGSDTVDNLELSDLDVYWTISAELIQKTKGLPPGASIGKVSVE